MVASTRWSSVCCQCRVIESLRATRTIYGNDILLETNGEDLSYIYNIVCVQCNCDYKYPIVLREKPLILYRHLMGIVAPNSLVIVQ
jgi:hypothetical protein